jgi:hypothetical protein
VRLITGKERDRLLTSCQREALHLEMRDSYAIGDEADRFATFLATGTRDLQAEAPSRQYWTDLIHGLTTAGRRIRRARVVSEPVSDYIRFEWAGTAAIVDAGEEVRWLPRRQASPLLLPGNDFWLFDAQTVVFSVFDGAGQVAERQLVDDQPIVKHCLAAFETVWQLATPHRDYRPT